MSRRAGEADAAGPREEPPRRVRRARGRQVDAEHRKRAQGDGDGAHEVPAFARAFPRDPELDRLVSAFEAGDYASVRQGARQLVHATESDDVRGAARELLRRLEPDPLAKALLALTAALLLFLSIWYWAHPHVAP